MRNPTLDEARARQRLALRAVPMEILSGWLPTKPGIAARPSPSPDVMFGEVALRRAADDLQVVMGRFLGLLVDIFHADVATVAIASRPARVSFEPIVAKLAELRRNAVSEIETIRIDDTGPRWAHLVVWADELADDGYRDPRLT